MKMEKKLPDFNKIREGFLKEEEPELFIGKETSLKFDWRIATKSLMDRAKRNTSVMGPRGLGKTTYLKRFLNILYEEQNKVVPLYYEFEEKKKDIIKVGDEITCTFAKQGISFFTKDKEVLKINDLETLKKYMRNKKFSNKKEEEFYFELYKDIRYYENRRDKVEAEERFKEYIIEEALGIARDVITCLNIATKERWGQRGVVVLDNAHILKCGLIDEKEIKEEIKIIERREKRKVTQEEKKRLLDIYAVDCESTIYDLAHDLDIWLIISGYKDYEMKKLCFKRDISYREYHPLKEKEVKELIKRIKKKYKIGRTYKNMYKDMFKLVGGNPGYIRYILLNKPKDIKKSFKTKEGLMEAFIYEVRNKEGKIYKIWEKIFKDACKILKLYKRKRDRDILYTAMEVVNKKLLETEKGKKYLDGEENNFEVNIWDIIRGIKKMKGESFEECVKTFDDRIREAFTTRDKLWHLSRSNLFRYDILFLRTFPLQDKILPLLTKILFLDLKIKEFTEEEKKEIEEAFINKVKEILFPEEEKINK